MASKLKAVDPKTAEPSKPKILIFGKPGVGKTWSSLDFPNVYYIDTEGGADMAHYTDKLKASGGVYFGVDQGALSFETILEQVEALATEKHPYKTLVIDSVSKIFSMEIAKEGERLGDKNAYGADKKPAVAYMRRLLSWLTRIDMNVILIAHEKPEWGLNSKGQREEIGVTFDAWEKVAYELHLSLNIFKVAGQHKARVTKSRLQEFKDAEVFEWSYDAFANKYGRSVIEAEVKQIALITPEQLAEISELLGRVKLPANQEEKWFDAAKCDKWEAMDTEKAAAIIGYIHKTFLTPKTATQGAK